MTTYPHHGLHVRRSRVPTLIALAVVVAAAIGVGVWLLVDHNSGSSSQSITDGQAIAFIETGQGLPGLNIVSGNPNLHGSPLPVNEQPYAVRMYRNGPYAANILNLFYAAGAAQTHFASPTEAQTILSAGRQALIAAAMARVTNPTWVTQYGVTVRQAATAAVRGLLAGAG